MAAEREPEKVKPVAIINEEYPWRSLITSKPDNLEKIRQAGNISRSKYHSLPLPTPQDCEVSRRRLNIRSPHRR